MNNSKKNLKLSILAMAIVLLGIVSFLYVKSLSQDPEVLVSYSGKTESGASFTITHPSSWVYYPFNCNTSGVAFWPESVAPDFSRGGACGADSFLESAPIILSTMTEPQLELKDASYQLIYTSMKDSLSY